MNLVQPQVEALVNKYTSIAMQLNEEWIAFCRRELNIQDSIIHTGVADLESNVNLVTEATLYMERTNNIDFKTAISKIKSGYHGRFRACFDARVR